MHLKIPAPIHHTPLTRISLLFECRRLNLRQSLTHLSIAV
jgi:hypothetical protein